MTNIDPRNRGSRNPSDGGVEFLGLIGALGVLGWLASSVAAVFAASTVTGYLALAAIVVITAMSIVVYRAHGWKSLPAALLTIGALWAALGGVVVFDHHWLAFTPATAFLNVLFIAALAAGAWAAFKKWQKALAALFAASLLTATVAFPRPAGGDGPLDTDKEWTIAVDVKDNDGQPLEGALVLCGGVMRWANALHLSETMARPTDPQGQVEKWKFQEDPRLKIVLCNVWKNADDANAGYPLVVKPVVSIVGGGDYELHFALTENAHPDVAYLALDLSADYRGDWYYLDFELWAGPPSQTFSRNYEGTQPLQVKRWGEFHGGLTIPAESARKDLRLRYHYEGQNGDNPPYWEVRTFHVGAIEPGTRKRLYLRIPNR